MIIGGISRDSFDSFTAKTIQAKVEFLKDQLAGRDTERRDALFLIFLTETGRYPENEELNRLDIIYISLGTKGILNHFTGLLPAKKTQQKYTLSDPAKIYVDVTFTRNYPYNTGIQRVVRKFCEYSRDLRYPIELFAFDEKTNQPRLLTADETKDFYNRSSGSSVVPSKGENSLRLVLRFLQKLPVFIAQDTFDITKRYYQRLRSNLLIPASDGSNAVKELLKIIDSTKHKFKTLLWQNEQIRKKRLILSTQGSATILVFSNQKVLLPELAFEDFRINFYSSIASRLKNSVHMIVYDLIPIIGPEFNSNTEPFVNYCRLLRHVDQAICISKSVANDVDHFSKVIIRENRKPLKVSTAYLGADFAPPPSEHRDLTNKSDPIPKILVVGTFEPRKNQIAILRAAHLLHSEGLRFKVVFAGNPGWKNEAFFTELDNLDPGRKFTEIIFQATDQELAQLYDQCKFTVFYSHLEGFGLPILESLNFGKPVLYANRGAMAEITKGLEGCIPVEPDNPMSLSAILKETILSRSFAMQSKVRNAIIENYSWRRFAQVLYESIQS